MNLGKANRAALSMILWSLAALAVLFAAAWVGSVLGSLVIAFYKAFLAAWVLFVAGALYLCRDPDPIAPSDPLAIVAPAHGTVDDIGQAVESDIVNGPCKRISIAVSLLDVQVHYAPVAARLTRCEHRIGQGAERKSAVELLTLEFEPHVERTGKFAVRVEGGRFGRRILPWTNSGEAVKRSQRISMARGGSRVTLFLPQNVQLMAKVGDKVVGGQSVVAKWNQGYG